MLSTDCGQYNNMCALTSVFSSSHVLQDTFSDAITGANPPLFCIQRGAPPSSVVMNFTIVNLCTQTIASCPFNNPPGRKLKIFNPNGASGNVQFYMTAGSLAADELANLDGESSSLWLAECHTVRLCSYNKLEATYRDIYTNFERPLTLPQSFARLFMTDTDSVSLAAGAVTRYESNFELSWQSCIT